MSELERLHQEHLARRSKWFPALVAPVASRPADPTVVVFRAPDISPGRRDVLWLSTTLDRVRKYRSTSEHFRLACKFVCHEFGVSANDIVSERRTAKVVLPRQIVMYLMKETTLRSLPDIGRRIGGRDHSTVIHGINKIAALVRADADFACVVAHLEAQLSI